MHNIWTWVQYVSLYVADVLEFCVRAQAMRKGKVLLDRAVEQCNQEALIQVGKLAVHIAVTGYIAHIHTISNSNISLLYLLLFKLPLLLVLFNKI